MLLNLPKDRNRTRRISATSLNKKTVLTLAQDLNHVLKMSQVRGQKLQVSFFFQIVLVFVERVPKIDLQNTDM